MANPLQTTAATGPITLTIPYRFLFIASIGNKAPYRTTRHSAGHTLLEAVEPLLATRMPITIPKNPIPSLTIPGLSDTQDSKAVPAFYQTYASPTFMNVSGPKLVRRLEDFLAEKRDVYRRLRERTLLMQVGRISEEDDLEDETKLKVRGELTTRGTHPSQLTLFNPTLVILHDELEAPLGRVKVKRGGPEQASLRGHRGLISVMESLRGKGLLRPVGQNQNQSQSQSQNQRQDDERLSILRIGVGIGRPASRQRDDVADYVLTEMSPEEMAAVRAAAEPTVEALMDEFYRAKEVD